MSKATAAEAQYLAETKDGVLNLTLNRPAVLNSLTHAMLGGLLADLRKAERDSAVRCVVLQAAGRAFCAGADLGDLKAMYEAKACLSLGEELRQHFNPLVAQLRRMEKPVVCAVNGTAAGAGASLALACDVKIASESAKFLLAFVSVGLAPDSGITRELVHRLGLSLALERAWTAAPITAAEALHYGLVNKVVKPEDLSAATQELVGRILKAPARAVALTKRSMNKALESSFSEHLEYEAQLQDVLGRSKDHLEGVTAFLEGRPPKFQGV